MQGAVLKTVIIWFFSIETELEVCLGCDEAACLFF